MRTVRRDPLVGIDRLLVDGSNLLHAMRRGGEPAPAPTLIGRLRAAVPPGVGIEVVIDGPPDPGSGNVRAASGLVVRYAGRSSGDEVLVRLVTQAAQVSFAAATGILVVTDDGALAAELRRRGATTIGTSWLIRRLDRATGSVGPGSIGRPTASRGPTGPRPPAASPRAADRGPDGRGGGRDGDRGLDGDGDREADPDVRRWEPGRGATAKRGNPRRVARSRREEDR